MDKQSLIKPGAKVAVMGLGVSGRAAVRYALHCGAEVAVSDTREEKQFVRDEAGLLSSTNVEWEAAGHSREFLMQRDLVLVSPGIPDDLPILQDLRRAGVAVAGEFAVAAGEIRVPVIAVTGTNGKTTVTTLIGSILSAAGNRVFVGGNIGTPLYEYLVAPDNYDVVVVEISSFQLENAGDFAPDVAVMLNISADHLDRHKTLANYLGLKMRLFAHQDQNQCAVVNGDDPLCRQLPSTVRSKIYTFGERKDSTAVFSSKGITVDFSGKRQEYPLADGVQSGRIAGMNFAAAILAATAAGCSDWAIRKGLKDFQPLPHRIEFVADVNGVSYYNDSKATNTGAVTAALSQFDDNVILIAGGRDKGDDFRLLRECVADHVRKVVLIGEAADLIEQALADRVATVRKASLPEAVRAAAQCARPGDVVLLSPGCASFDMFQSYGHRGEVFRSEVLALQAGDGRSVVESIG
ncbi:MAG: UDP-N-acetylmuramoyl-L-alanine--D-glutamate ligase [Desulforhopalus sp.]